MNRPENLEFPRQHFVRDVLIISASAVAGCLGGLMNADKMPIQETAFRIQSAGGLGAGLGISIGLLGNYVLGRMDLIVERGINKVKPAIDKGRERLAHPHFGSVPII